MNHVEAPTHRMSRPCKTCGKWWMTETTYTALAGVCFTCQTSRP